MCAYVKGEEVTALRPFFLSFFLALSNLVSWGSVLSYSGIGGVELLLAGWGIKKRE